MTTTRKTTKKNTNPVKPQKRRLKPTPKQSVKELMKTIELGNRVMLYGVNPFMVELVNEIWKHPNTTIFISAPNPTEMTLLNRDMIGRSGSVSRWVMCSTDNFIEHPFTDEYIITIKEHYEEVTRRNTWDLPILVVEDFA